MRDKLESFVYDLNKLSDQLLHCSDNVKIKRFLHHYKDFVEKDDESKLLFIKAKDALKLIVNYKQSTSTREKEKLKKKAERIEKIIMRIIAEKRKELD
ncbi:hypothetical protein [Marinicrinis sediminis]|uniref:Uncharacterized protein n=1 Tax=Marinicrinis sediminis TaxID=1652465 RepID=A0ABW5RCP9_9BACL